MSAKNLAIIFQSWSNTALDISILFCDDCSVMAFMALVKAGFLLFTALRLAEQSSSEMLFKTDAAHKLCTFHNID